VQLFRKESTLERLDFSAGFNARLLIVRVLWLIAGPERANSLARSTRRLEALPYFEAPGAARRSRATSSARAERSIA
jgi:hypothetical protein